ncbi:DNA adenine methylase [Escherichia coli]|uniref:Dam family site-specific DNA-(adenine-N6)-methyltransferase n=1 Tax=Escherichia coli TaxID=562 RepID=UPI001EF6C883|nr:Dam family site-specific DNA-(adenine-N6)-methyltransferase [Escherichia coli]CAB5615130.1 DNA adenine methylase [Escherichia coli]CAC9203706.1 DNA adenine methylase [Escherichia coli]
MTGLSYGSVCSGIEAASIAWEPLGMRPAWFAEIEPFPCAVLAARWPEISNLGDMTQIAKAVRIGDVKAPDVVVGGTPCQAFSVAGLRNGLSDTRGQLTLSYVELANAIDDKRRESRESETIFVWENVPGVLSSKDNAFGCFLAGLGGEDEPFEPGERPAKGKNSKFWRWDKATNKHVPKWPKSGFLVGRQRRLAWRVLDAQYFGVAQRRKRVFVVASARKDFDPSKILFEFEGVRRDSPPSRGQGEEVAGTLKARANSGGWSHDVDMAASGYMQVVGSHWDNPTNPHPTLNQSHNSGGIGASNQEIFAQRGAGIVGTFRMCAFGEYADDDTASTVKARDYKDATDLAVYSSTGIGSWSKGDVVGTLRAREQESHEHLSVIAFPERMSATQCASAENISPSLMSQNPTAIALTVADPDGVAFAFAENNRSEIRFQNGDGQISGPLSAGGGKPGQGYPTVLAFQERGREDGRTLEFNGDLAYALTSPNGGGRAQERNIVDFRNMAVRRLTPVECERLQGFPDNHTLIPVNKRNKLIADELAYLRSHFPDMPEDEANFLAVDGPRYKAIGNSMAVPVMRWIGERIVKAICVSDAPAARTKPFLKWAGGKYSVIDDVLAHLPSGRRLIEPFAGGGSVFLNAGFAEVIASDACDDLILTYQVMQREPFALIDKAAMMFREGNNSDYFDKIKARFNKREMTQLERAAAFIYLNRHCYNGLMRYNLKGEFNVGFGSYRQPYFPLAEMESFATLARRYTFALADYSDTVALAGEGDVVFCDPPYEPMPGKSGFTNYSGQRFRFEDQACLAQALKSAHQRGASVVVTNSGAPAINELYKSLGFRVMSLRARRSISCAGDTRETVTDIIGVLA